MKFFSTNKQSPKVDFKTALFSGLAPDGGLYMPQAIPQFTKDEIDSFPTLSLHQIASLVLQKWIPDIPEKDMDTIVKKALTFSIPVTKHGNKYFLELFHGPTMAFKDIAASVLAQLFAYYLKKEDREVMILVATSGDTGGAIAQAFSGVANVRVVVFYPEGRVSQLQEEQLTRVGDNIASVRVKGTFDDCQAFVKKAFVDPDLHSLHLSSANSISVGRLLPQILYYVWAYAQLSTKPLQFVVPSGNLGNVTAGVFAKNMGIPIDSFVIATNENDAVYEYYQSGSYAGKDTKQTLSNAMDVGSPSNMVRLLSLFSNNYDAFRQFIQVEKVSDEETVKTILSWNQKTNYLFDFHTAVAVTAAERAISDKTQVITSTASPKKFAKEMQQATNIYIDDSQEIEELQKKEKRVSECSNSYKELKELLLSRTLFDEKSQ